MNKSKKILLFGNERIATSVNTNALVFKYLMENYNVVGLVVSEKNDINDLEVVKIAEKNNIPVHNYPKLKESIEEIRNIGADIAVLIAYGKIIPQSVIDIFPMGIINMHPSLLPKHRGPTPLESVILNDDDETAVSVMKLSKDMDSGPVYAQKAIKLSGNETKQELSDKLDGLGLEIFQENFEDILENKIIPVEQKHELATYDKLITKSDGLINWNEDSKLIINKIRAFQGWPGSKTNFNDLNVKIIRAEISDEKGTPGELKIVDSDIYVYTADSSVKILELQPEGRKIMTSKDFLLGYKNKIS